ncbi:MAG: ATP-binding protein, partial [Bdellovibrionota bacterium]
LPRGRFYVQEADGHYFFFRYHGPSSFLPGSSHAGGYRYHSFADLAEGRVPVEEIAGKILLVSTISREDSGDFVLTPYSRMPVSHPKLVAHANILDSVLHDQGLILAPAWGNTLATFLLTSFVLAWIIASTPLQGLIATLGLAVGYLLLAHLLFQLAGIWIRVSEPLIGIFVVYYLVVPYRLIMEYRKRWEYQRRNVLLLQVEELKSNFLSLVTHDLKTPVARIQGLAEVLLRKAADRLVDRDRETLHNIIDSTDELNRFITSILDLSKIESSRLNLNLEQKDVNQLIERAIEQFKPQARAQNKRIVAQLDPLFPIRLDASLISKVLNNLIDNALKYSPPGSTVTVSSRETSEWVEIAVRDQGIGLTLEEKRRLFTRFFRAQNETTMKVKGTGLGLYVTKYFIEAHYGRVDLESERGKGSVFKILLPLQMPEQSESENRDEPGVHAGRPGLLVALKNIVVKKTKREIG